MTDNTQIQTLINKIDSLITVINEQQKRIEKLDQNVQDQRKEIESFISAQRERDKLQNFSNGVTDNWVPRWLLMNFLRYGDTQMAHLEKTFDLGTSQIGKRKFYRKDRVEKLFEDNCLK